MPMWQSPPVAKVADMEFASRSSAGRRRGPGAVVIDEGKEVVSVGARLVGGSGGIPAGEEDADED